MMIATTLAALFTIVTIATALSLVDSWIRGRSAYAGLKREKMLLEAGFVPQVQAREVRLRRPARRTLAAATRPYARRVPLTNLELSGQLAG